MDHLQQLKHQVRQYVFIVVLLENLALVACFWAIEQFSGLPTLINALISLLLSLVLGVAVMKIVSDYVVVPTQALWQAILHLSPTEHGIPAPKPEELRVGRELVTSLTAQIYQLASVAEHAAEEGHLQSSDVRRNFVAQNLPLPLFVLDPSEIVTFANEAAAQYIGIAVEDLIGKNIYMVLDMSFPSEDTFD
ncbi:MAG TPA: PAS domain-containing protein, partial [Verrucomicrobiae bacterium]|nr:PAS domain-containing protein [Verrucomicrobiae bacterium]